MAKDPKKLLQALASMGASVGMTADDIADHILTGLPINVSVKSAMAELQRRAPPPVGLTQQVYGDYTFVHHASGIRGPTVVTELEVWAAYLVTNDDVWKGPEQSDWRVVALGIDLSACMHNVVAHLERRVKDAHDQLHRNLVAFEIDHG